jgi:hypothetical protein
MEVIVPGNGRRRLTLDNMGCDWKFETFGHSAEPGGISGRLLADIADSEAIEWMDDDELCRWTPGRSYGLALFTGTCLDVMAPISDTA